MLSRTTPPRPPRPPAPLAMSIGVRPALFLTIFAPRSSSSLTTASPRDTEPCSAVLPALFVVLISTPRSSSSVTASTAPASVGTRMRGPSPRGGPSPWPAAIIRTVVPSGSVAFGSAPVSSSRRMTATSFVRAARISGVAPAPKFSVAPGSREIFGGVSLSFAFGSAPCLSSTLTRPVPSRLSRQIGAGRLCTHCSVFHSTAA